MPSTSPDQDSDPLIVAKPGSDVPPPDPKHSWLGRLWLHSSEMRPGVGAVIGYSLSTILGVALLVLCVPQLWRLGYGEIQGLCFGCKTAPVFRLAEQPWSAIALACIYLNGLIAGLYGIYQGVLWMYAGSRRLRRKLIRQRRQQEST